jgi:hypothetical protein
MFFVPPDTVIYDKIWRHMKDKSKQKLRGRRLENHSKRRTRSFSRLPKKTKSNGCLP